MKKNLGTELVSDWKKRKNWIYLGQPLEAKYL
jgi:hypothetical protein